MHGRYLLWLLIAASALQLACGGGAAMPKSAPAPSTAAQLSVTPSNFSFGTVLVGKSKSLNAIWRAVSKIEFLAAAWHLLHRCQRPIWRHVLLCRDRGGSGLGREPAFQPDVGHNSLTC